MKSLTIPKLPKLSIFVLGESGVGKSSLISAYLGSDPPSQPTVGIDCQGSVLEVNGGDMYVHFFDVSGNPMFNEISNEFYSDSHGFLIVFDITNKQSFSQLSRWLTEGKEAHADFGTAVLIGNKSDSGKPAVGLQDIKQFTKTLGIQYFQASAKTGENVREAIDSLCELASFKAK